jgi:small conductance mechanosensitive channel
MMTPPDPTLLDSLAALAEKGTLADACGVEPGWFCERTWELTENEALSKAVDWAIGAPVRSLVIVLVAYVLNRLARRGIDRTVGRVVRPQDLAAAGLGKLGLKTPEVLTSGVRDVRSESRARTISAVVKSTVSVIIWTITALIVLGEFGVNLAPLIAGAGIAGVAIGFGAQSLVKDCITGMFMLVEDQYGVGDIVDLGEATGVVEAITLRVTRLRSADGTVWHVPNGVVTRVGNKSQHWSMALLDVEVAYGTEVDRATAVILDAATEVCSRDDFAASILEPPQVLGVERLDPNGVVLRLTVKTNPGQQWPLMRALRAAIKQALDAEGIEIPFPQRTVWVRGDGPSPS